MSNKIVPTVYRNVVDDVMVNIRSEFEEFGVGEHVLQDLQSRWEVKIMRSNVAEFERSATLPSVGQNQLMYPSAAPPLPGPPQSSRYAPPPLDVPPPLAGPPPSLYQRGHTNGAGLNLSLPSHYGMDDNTPVKSETRIPQLDGPSASSRDSSVSSEGSPSPPTKPVPLPSLKVESATHVDDEAVIGSDLDDSDDEDNLAGGADDPVGGAKDIVFCTYDKVQRVKNKWKCVLKDGMVHLHGKDYLFSKCTGEFEW
ncbi:hypothetical protein BS47DRAFT_1370813 [Hydnum rufescens UP504]|uniref:Transcription initiation factor IIA large subunit n=1 Tax=Hydnum rufescens UP504 TaxID=1448309 RepID=A0A9P6B7M2_9AGAM|nr:hypothetical protein BS47DRAFT_1370813 [Hydnum rufescens UP504]